MLAALARGGAGNELFAEEADTAAALISGEIEGLLTQVAQAASLRVVSTAHVANIQVLNELPVVGLPDGVMLDLGSFYAGRHAAPRRLRTGRPAADSSPLTEARLSCASLVRW